MVVIVYRLMENANRVFDCLGKECYCDAQRSGRLRGVVRYNRTMGALWNLSEFRV